MARAIITIIQLTVYVKYREITVWNCGCLKKVNIHRSLTPHIPTRETMVGSMAYPMPLKDPTSTSIIPHSA